MKIPADAEIIDLSQDTVLPGLIDAHTHVFGNGPDLEAQILRDSYQYRTLTALANANKDLMVGFTTLRDLKTLGAMYSDVDLRNAIDRGIVQGPRMQVSTRGIQSTGGFLMNGYSAEVPVPMALQVADSPSAAREAVREQIAHGTTGSSCMLLTNFISLETANGDSSHLYCRKKWRPSWTRLIRKAIRSPATPSAEEGLRNCLNAGVDSIEHGVLLEDSDIKMMVEKGIYLLGTLFTTSWTANTTRKGWWAQCGGDFRAHVSKGGSSRCQDCVWIRGWPIPTWQPNEGIRVYGEIWDDSDAAIRAATMGAATLMGWEDRVGSLESGQVRRHGRGEGRSDGRHHGA